MNENMQREPAHDREAQRPEQPFDRREWAAVGAEAEKSLRRQYGREVRQHADG